MDNKDTMMTNGKELLSNFENENTECGLCKIRYGKMASVDKDKTITSHTPNIQLPSEQESRDFTISENIFGVFCSSTKSEHEKQQENVYKALAKIKKSFQNSNVKLYCLTDTCSEVKKLCETSSNFEIDLTKPPKLKSILIFCESIFDWLAKSGDNRVLIYCQEPLSILILMIYAYSCYYNAILRRDLRLSIAIKSFVNANMKYLEKIPVSYRRYSEYMSLYSCMNQLQSLRSSVYINCIILYSFPSMESDKDKCVQLFFKIYTNDPLVCCHTTKLYPLSSTVNRLVILFDKYPISLRYDTMLVCYHRSFSVNKRTKLFRLNFHTCQAISDMLTFYCQDFEEVYPGCSSKMKIDLYFRETAVFEQGEHDYILESSHSDLSSIERADSYTFLNSESNLCKIGSSVVINNNYKKRILKSNSLNESDLKDFSKPAFKNTASITVYKTSVDDHRSKTDKVSDIQNVINQSGRISGPMDSHHSTKMDTIRTSSSVLNGTVSNCYDFKMETPNFGHSSLQSKISSRTDRDKCNQQLDTLMKDLNLESATSANSSRFDSADFLHNNESFQRCKRQMSSQTTTNKEYQLMTELLEAQKEISNLRRSINHLDMTDQTSRGFVSSNKSVDMLSSPRNKSLSKGFTSSSHSEQVHQNGSRNNNWQTNDNDSSRWKSDSIQSSQMSANREHLFNVETSSDQHFQNSRPIGYYDHKEGLKRDQQMKGKYLSTEQMRNQKLQNEKEMNDVVEEIETINLQLIGKGIQDLSKASPQMKMHTGMSKIGSKMHFISDSVGSLSPLSTRQNSLSKREESRNAMKFSNDVCDFSMKKNMTLQNNQHNITLEMVEDMIHNWYQPQFTREEAISMLRNSSPGSFLIRDSNSYAGAYGLAIKVATIPQNITVKSDDIESEKVRHYLIELVGNQGVSFKGFPEEPIFSSLSHLVLYYTNVSSVLPCLLTLSNKSAFSTDVSDSYKKFINNQSKVSNSPKSFNNRKNDVHVSDFSVHYLGCFDVEYITGPSVINKAIERLLEQNDGKKFTECQMRINPGEGIVLTDLERKLFFRRNHPFNTISYCGTDPRERKLELDVCKSKGLKKTKVFGIIIKAYVAGESKCFLFGELDSYNKASSIVQKINEQMIKATENL